MESSLQNVPDPPKMNAVYVMRRCKQAAKEKLMPFIQPVGDQPVYPLILEEKNENPREFDLVLQSLELSILMFSFPYPWCLWQLRTVGLRGLA